MASLTSQAINASYNGLLKSLSNGPLTSFQTITDGDGNQTPLALGTTQFALSNGATQGDIVADTLTLADTTLANAQQFTSSGIQFAGGVDFSFATVTGLPGGGGGITAVSHMPATAMAIPQTSTDEIVYSLLVPANTFAAGDIVVVRAIANIAAGQPYFSMWIHTSPALFSGFPIAVGTTTNPAIAFEKTLYVASSTTSTKWWDENFANEAYAAGSGIAQFAFNDQPINWTVDQYLMLQGYADPGVIGNWHGVTMSKIN
jgi:hypothetical protein